MEGTDTRCVQQLDTTYSEIFEPVDDDGCEQPRFKLRNKQKNRCAAMLVSVVHASRLLRKYDHHCIDCKAAPSLL